MLVTEKNKVLNRLLQLYCILLPFEEAFASSIGSIQRIIGFIIIAFIIIIRHGKILVRRNCILLLIWLIYSFVSVLWVISVPDWMYFIKIYAVQILFVFVVLSVDPADIDLHQFRMALILGGIIAAAILAFFPSASLLTEEGRRTIILFGRMLDPNIVATNMSMGLVAAVGEYIEQKKNKHRSLFLLSSCLIFLGVLYTGSRGAVIALVIGLFSLIYPELRNKTNNKWARRLVLLGGVAVVAIISFLPQDLVQARFSKDTFLGLNEYTAGVHNRYTIWECAFQVFTKKVLLGYGCGNFFDAIALVYKRTASHNLFILLLVEGGIVGFSLFAMYLFKLTKKMFNTKDYITISIFITIIVMSLSLDSITYKYFWLTLIYVEISNLQIHKYYRKL